MYIQNQRCDKTACRAISANEGTDCCFSYLLNLLMNSFSSIAIHSCDSRPRVRCEQHDITTKTARSSVIHSKQRHHNHRRIYRASITNRRTQGQHSTYEMALTRGRTDHCSNTFSRAWIVGRLLLIYLGPKVCFLSRRPHCGVPGFHNFTFTFSQKWTFSSCYVELWTMILSYELNSDRVKLNQLSKYLHQPSLSLKVIVRKRRHTHPIVRLLYKATKMDSKMTVYWLANAAWSLRLKYMVTS